VHADDLPLAATAPPAPGDVVRWLAADAAARPGRLELLRARLAEGHVDAYFGIRPEDSRYLTGFSLRDGEAMVSGVSGQFLVAADETVVLADSRYRLQADEQCPGSRIEDVYGDLPDRWPGLLAGLRPLGGGRMARVALDAGAVSHATWQRLAAATPDVELVDAGGWLDELRQAKDPTEVERIGAACAVADGALERLLPSIRPGVTEHDLALALEWEMRRHGAEALAFDVACLAGPRAALPHGSPGDRPVAAGEVLLFDFGAQVCGYRSDMTRTLFVGEPTPRDLALHALVARAQGAAFDVLAQSAAVGERPLNRMVDAAARDVITVAGYGERFGHGLGHGIGLATHEAPSLGRRAPERPLPSPTVFSVEPGIYLDGETGMRIEDLVAFDAGSGRCERLTRFPREVVIVGV
jgi:Xaa-Pro aminopeptidase